jgi:hypothetical protein
MGWFGDSSEGAEQRVVFSNSGDVRVTVRSVDDAKLALKELKLKKKELAIEKREVTSRQQGIRADYTDSRRRQGSMLRGGRSFGRFVRGVQQFQRDAVRRDLARQLAPLEQARAKLDARIAAVDKAILQVESYIVQNT